MAIHLAPAASENLSTSIDAPIDISLLEKHLSNSEFNELMSNVNGDVYGFAVSENNRKKFHNKYNPGDLVLLAETGKGKFTRVGVVVSTTTNRALGEEIWPFSGKSPWSHIYFLQHIKKIDLAKSTILEELNFPPKTPLSWPECLEDSSLRIRKFEERHGITFPQWLDVHLENLDNASPGISFHQTAVKQRIGQQKFREQTLAIYNSKCAISECDVTYVLQAAHIIGVTDSEGSHLSENSLLLRSDLHLLFDQHYLYIEPDSLKVKIHPELHSKFSSSQSHYGNYENTVIFSPKEGVPSRELLARHKARCLEKYCDA